MALMAVERVHLSKRAHLWQINKLMLFKHLLRVTRLQVRGLPIPAISLATSLPVTVLQLILGHRLIRDLLQISQDRLTKVAVMGPSRRQAASEGLASIRRVIARQQGVVPVQQRLVQA
jgi:hypothetical protein